MDILRNPALMQESLIKQMRKMMSADLYRSHKSRGTLFQERAFFSSAPHGSLETVMPHTILADEDMSEMAEGSGTATTDGS
jgi:hypothetical protein